MNFLGEAPDARVININAGVGVEEEEIDAIEFDAVHFGVGGEVEHLVEINGGFSARAAFADEAGPHGIVKFGIVAVGMLRAHKLGF